MKLADLIIDLQKLAKENHKAGGYNLEVYDEYTGNFHDFKLSVVNNEIEIRINTETD